MPDARGCRILEITGGPAADVQVDAAGSQQGGTKPVTWMWGAMLATLIAGPLKAVAALAVGLPFLPAALLGGSVGRGEPGGGACQGVTAYPNSTWSCAALASDACGDLVAESRAALALDGGDPALPAQGEAW